MGDAGGERPIEVGVLGPFRVSVGGSPVDVPPGRLRVLLAVLAMSAGRPVAVERLIDGVWGDELPADARRTLHTYVARLRKVLGSASVVREQAGYVLYTPADNVDALRFPRLVDRALGEPLVERELLVEALGLWRGQPFEGLGSAWLDRSEAGRLDEQRLSAVERRIDLDLASGRAAELVAELDGLAAEYSLRESLWSRFLTALGQAGRQAEALERYETIRARIADELGVDPSPDLQRIYSRLLEGDVPTAASNGRGAGPVGASVPRQLPADVGTFRGRTAMLGALDELLVPPTNADSGGPAIVVVHGVGGVGKTTLAVHWAHRAASSFPDGQVYLNLRGYGPTEPMSVASALDTLLRGLGVAADQVPTEIEARTNLLRSILADRRMLLLLDNAQSADQVRPLLPGVGDSHVIVTSRSQLRGLVAREGAQRIAVHVLTGSESVALLEATLGASGVSYDTDVLTELADRCGHLPLALAIAAERATRAPESGLQELVTELRETQERLDALDVGEDDTTSLRAVFAWSYQALDADSARMFRMLGLPRGPDISGPAAAALAGTDPATARRLLDRLVDANLLQQRPGGRYELHDLVRSYAAELVGDIDSESEQEAALDRLFEWYVHAVANARRTALDPRDPLIEVAAPAQTDPMRFDTVDDALAWFDAEHQGVVATVRLAADRGRPRRTFQLVDLVYLYLRHRRALDDLFTLLPLASTAVRSIEDLAAEAQCDNCLGLTHAELGDLEEAHACFGRALELFTAAGHDRGQIRVLDNLGAIAQQLGRGTEAIEHHGRALEVARRLGSPPEAVSPLNNLAVCYFEAGRLDEAAELCRQALDICRRSRVEPGKYAMVWDTFGSVWTAQGQYVDAISCFEEALRIERASQDRWREVVTLTNLGRCLRDADRQPEAQTAWCRALDLLDETGAASGWNVRRTELVDLLDSVDPT